MNGAESHGAESAADFFEEFHWGRPARKARRVALPPPPEALTEIGRLEAITYSTRKGKQSAHWEHEFGEEGGRKPTLAVDPKTRRLHVVGGDYDVQERGIVN